MKISIRFSADVEVEADNEEIADAARRNIEIQAARWAEEFEAIIIERVQPLHPEAKFTAGPEEEES